MKNGITNILVNRKNGIILAVALFMCGSFFAGSGINSADTSGNEFPIPVSGGGTNAANAEDARTNLDVFQRDEMLLALYPVGSIYMSTTNTNPGTLFGGTWSVWGEGRSPISVNASDSYLNGSDKTGGSVNPLTNHSHKYVPSNNSNQSGKNSGSNNKVNNGNATASTGAANVGTGKDGAHANWQSWITTYMFKRTA